MSTKDLADFEYILGDPTHEVERLGLWNDVLINNAMGGKPVLAPIDLAKPDLKVLDAGCADGAWLRSISAHMTQPFELVGIDTMEPFFPKSPPAGYKFIKRSFTDPWPQEYANKFDIVQCRASLAACGPIPIKDVIKSMVGCLKPGGWIQLIDIDMRDQPENGEGMKGMLHVGRTFFDSIGVGGLFSLQLKKWLEEAGCADANEEFLGIKAGPLCDQGPEAAQKAVAAAVRSTSALIQGAKQFGISVDAAVLDNVVPQLKTDLLEKGGVWRVVVAYARKP